MKRIGLTAIIFGLLSGISVAQQLPKIATPHHYILQFAPDFKTDKFGGEETIHGDTLVATDKIVLNAVDIEFHSVTVQALPAKSGEKPGEVLTATVTEDPKTEMATLQLPKQIPAGPFELKISYTGTLND